MIAFAPRPLPMVQRNCCSLSQSPTVPIVVQGSPSLMQIFLLVTHTYIACERRVCAALYARNAHGTLVVFVRSDKVIGVSRCERPCGLGDSHGLWPPLP